MTRYTVAARALHWIMAALIIPALFVGLIIYLIADGVLSRREARAATVEETVAA